ncbi:hypothetical protein V8E53_006858 [Lactarius tabidus]
MTNSQICSGQILHACDINPWTQHEVFQLGFGLFHLCLNLLWALLHVHRGSLEQMGSLAYFFTLIEKTRLRGEHPDYHTLLSALMQVLDSILLNAWRHKSGYNNLREFASTEPLAEDLLNMAGDIIAKHATPMEMPNTLNKKKAPAVDDDESDNESDADSEASFTPGGSLTISFADPDKDRAHQNICLLSRDLLYMAELIRAISDGDIGCVEDMLPLLAMMDIVCDNMLVNLLGLTGHAMPIDLNIKHLIGKLKGLLQAKGLQSTWDHLGNISAAVDILKKLKKQVATSMKTAYQGMTHKAPKTDHLIWRVANRVRKEMLHLYKDDRIGNKKTKLVLNMIYGRSMMRTWRRTLFL